MSSLESLPKAKTGRNASAKTEQPTLRQQPAKRPTNQSSKRSAIKRFLVLLLLLACIVLASIGATIYFTWPASADLIGLKINNQKRVEQPLIKKPEPTPAASKAPIFLTLEPFTSTISDGTRSRIFHVAITPQVSDEGSLLLLKEYNPIVRDRILRILSEQHPIHIQTPEGRQQLVDSLLSSLSAPYGKDPSTSPRIRDVLFTAFVIQ